MRKVIITLCALMVATPALADWRRNQHYQPQRQQHHYEHRHRGGINPWIAGAIGLGVLGAGAYYYNQRQCWNEYVVDMYGRQVYDRYGRPLAQTVCQ
jgi:multisubunit Na+/H+ antiporter MnhB subunit